MPVRKADGIIRKADLQNVLNNWSYVCVRYIFLRCLSSYIVLQTGADDDDEPVKAYLEELIKNDQISVHFSEIFLKLNIELKALNPSSKEFTTLQKLINEFKKQKLKLNIKEHPLIDPSFDLEYIKEERCVYSLVRPFEPLVRPFEPLVTNVHYLFIFFLPNLFLFF